MDTTAPFAAVPATPAPGGTFEVPDQHTLRQHVRTVHKASPGLSHDQVTNQILTRLNLPPRPETADWHAFHHAVMAAIHYDQRPRTPLAA